MLNFIVKYWRRLLAIGILLCLIAAGIFRGRLLTYLNSDADTVYQNYIIEFVAGIVFPLVPILLGVYVGKRIKELEFYNNVAAVLSTLIKLRERGLMDPPTVRHLVKTVVNNFGNEAVKEQRIEKIAQKVSQQRGNQTDECRVCTLKVIVVGGKCGHCKLHCYAWDFSSLSKEEKEIREIQRIVELKKASRKEK